MKNSIGIVGPGSVGKTTLVQWLLNQRFVNFGYQPTIINFQQYICHQENIDIMLIDTGGQQQVKTIRQASLRGCQSFIITFDLSDARSFISIKHQWIAIKQQYPVDRRLVCVIGNKSDLKRAVDFDFVSHYWKQQNVEYMQMSLLEDKNIKQRIDSVIRRMSLENKLKQSNQNLIKLSNQLGKKNNKNNRKRCCFG